MIDFEEIAVLDKNAFHLGVPTVNLMENAGSEVAKAALEFHKGPIDSVAIFCGLGNNGGDGLVAARYFAYEPQCYVRVYLLGDRSEIRSAIASEQYNRLQKRIELFSIKKSNVKQMKSIDLSGYTVVIDAMLGVGISGKLREPYRSIVNLINSARAGGQTKTGQIGRKSKNSQTTVAPTYTGKRPIIIAVDVPTGLGTDGAVMPDITVTFHDSKTGMNKENSGKILIRDIGIPKEAEEYAGPGELIFIPKLKIESHKGDRGKLLIIGGGPYTGAPALMGLSALRMGVDLVHIATPNTIANTVASFSPNFIVHRLEHEESYLTEEDVDEIIRLTTTLPADAVVMGPGLGRADETFNAVKKIIKELPNNIPLVLDADALSALAILSSAGRTRLLKSHTGILTPHRTELSNLLKTISLPESTKDLEELQKIVKQFAKKLGGNWSLLLKGPIDIISDGNDLKSNRTGNPGMTVGGTGDVLAGISGALLAMGLNHYKAARCAAFINGYSGDLAWDEYRNGLTATDIIEMIPQCLKDNM